ncbi:hypothetical protein [Microbacterium aurantiacum]|uniref:hypothetical protein n=1 Tax=Microbacterium aurantiacum TaxID=162393 RepID=UPI0015E0CAEE|nr:hypothetical protein [Microbacterium aurantiacum]
MSAENDVHGIINDTKAACGRTKATKLSNKPFEVTCRECQAAARADEAAALQLARA